MEKRFILLVTFLSVVMIAMAQPVSDSDTSGSVRSGIVSEVHNTLGLHRIIVPSLK